MVDRHPEVARCYQTKVLSTFHDDPGSNLFNECQFESLARDSHEYLTHAAQYRHSTATRWILQANRHGMYVSPDAAFTWNHFPPTRHPTQHAVIITRVVGHEWVHRSYECGVVVIDLFGGMGAMLESILRSGLRVIKYHYCDVCPTAAKVMRHRINELMARYPELLSSDATK